MAISARASQIYNQRQKYSAFSKFGGGTRVSLGSSLSSASSAIAKKTIETELQTKIGQYNDGIISNQDMLDFLKKTSENPILSPIERDEVKGRITDFTDRITLEKLTTSFQSSPDGSPEQLTSAQALASFYERKASTLQDSPAQQNALQSAATWRSNIVSIKSNIQKTYLQNLRYKEEAKVNAIADNTSEQAMQKAEMWRTLHDQAVKDGDEVGANKYAAYYQDAITKAETLSSNESTKANKKQLTDFINSAINEYHDGMISGEEALAKLEQANQFADSIGDTAALLRLNNLSITINKEIDKGVTYSNVNGLSTKSKGSASSGELYLNPDGSISLGGGTSSTGKAAGNPKGVARSKGGKTVAGSQLGGSGEKSKSVSELEIEYKNILNEAQKALILGKKVTSDGKTVKYDTKAYTDDIILINKARQLELQNIASGLGELQAAGIKKIGKTQIETLITDTAKQLQTVTSQYNQVRSGNVALSIKDGTFTDASGVSYKKPQLTWVPKGETGNMVQAGGIYYPTSKENVIYEDQAKALAYAKDKSTKEAPLSVVRNSAGQYAVVDAEGNQVQRNLLTVSDPEGNSIVYEKDAKYGWLPQAVGPRTGTLRKQIVKEFDNATNQNLSYKPNLMTYNQINSFDFKSPVGSTAPLPPEDPGAAQKINNIIKPIVSKAVSSVQNAPSQISDFNPNTQLVQPSQPVLRIPTPTLQLTTASPITKMAQSSGMAPVKIAAPVTNTPKITPTQLSSFNKQAEELRNKNNQPITTQIKNTVKNVANKVTSLFKR